MKELREYQQSEAYKMCAEKLQEKKIKKGAFAKPSDAVLEGSEGCVRAKSKTSPMSGGEVADWCPYRMLLSTLEGSHVVYCRD